MAFRLSHRRPVRAQLERIARRELDVALDQLDGTLADAQAIHDARKSVKKVRAVLRLLREAVGAGYTKENGRLRRAARSLSALRDADATVGSLRLLRARYPTVVTPTVARAVRRGLKRRKRRERRRSRAIAVHAKGMLRGARRSLPRRVGRAGKRKALVSGAARGYRRARRALRDLEPDSAAVRFHDWRKRVKDHRYHIRLLQGLHDGARGRARTLKRLDRLLGDDHDLAVLQAVVLDDSRRYGNARTTGLVLGGIARRRDALRRCALSIGRRTFAARPREFEAIVATWARGRERRR